MIQELGKEETKTAPGGRSCAGCFEPDTPEAPLPYEMEVNLEGYPPDLYCPKCYQAFRNFYEDAEDAIIAALRRYRLPEIYTPKHLKAALESLADTEEKRFAQYLEQGTASALRPRSDSPKPS